MDIVEGDAAALAVEALIPEEQAEVAGILQLSQVDVLHHPDGVVAFLSHEVDAGQLYLLAALADGHHVDTVEPAGQTAHGIGKRGLQGMGHREFACVEIKGVIAARLPHQRTRAAGLVVADIGNIGVGRGVGTILHVVE